MSCCLETNISQKLKCPLNIAVKCMALIYVICRLTVIKPKELTVPFYCAKFNLDSQHINNA